MKLEKILCIDDEEDILEIAKMALEAVGGFDVTCSGSGEEGIEQAQSLKPDLILLDVMMPEMNGPATLKKMRGVSGLDKIPVVFMTARVQPAEIKEYLELGGVAVIQKPFDPMALSGQILKIWQEQKQANQ